MDYFLLSDALLGIGKGGFPQSQNAINKDSPYGALRERENDLRFLTGRRVDHMTAIPQPVLQPKAKLTDNISSSSISKFILSPKAKEIIETGKVFAAELIPTSVIWKGDYYDYWIMHHYEDGYQFLDVEGTRVEMVKTRSSMEQTGHVLQTDTWEQIKWEDETTRRFFRERTNPDARWQGPEPMITRYAVRKDAEIDLFAIHTRTFVSARMRYYLEKECTGFQFLELETMTPEWRDESNKKLREQVRQENQN